jgi:hypothetical protein
MSQSPNLDPGVGQPQVEPATSTTHWGKAPPEPEITQFLQGPQQRGFELRGYPGTTALFSCRNRNGIFFRVLSGASRLSIKWIALILMRDSLESVRYS